MRKLCSILLGGLLCATASLSARNPVVFISAFAGGEDGDGAIHTCRLNPETGELRLAHRITDVKHPFFTALSPNGKFLYTIHAEQFNNGEIEQVAAYAIEGNSGQLKLLNRQSSQGTASCYLEVDATGGSVLVANYSTGSVAVLPVREDGSLDEIASFAQHAGSSVNPERQTGPKAHSIILSPDNRFAYAADLGIDKIMIYRFDSEAVNLTPAAQPFVRTPAGAGPRHLIFHPDGNYLYAINELKNSISLYDQDAKTGTLSLRQTISTLPEDFEGTSHCADLKITPDGKFLYGTNRGHDSIAIFRLEGDGGMHRIGMEPSLGKGPQNLMITPDGGLLLCANMPGNNVAVFRINRGTGELTSLGEPLAVPKPSCIRLLAD